MSRARRTVIAAVAAALLASGVAATVVAGPVAADGASGGDGPPGYTTVTDDTGTITMQVPDGSLIDTAPFDWNGDGIDTIGVFNKGTWYRDVDGDGKWSLKDETTAYGRKGDKPVVGDFNGDGIDEIGFYRDGVFYLDTNTNGQLDEDDEVISLGAAGAPVVGDWDGDGVDEVGVYQANVSDMRSASKP